MKPLFLLVPLMAAVFSSCGKSSSTQESVNYSVMTVKTDTVTLNELYSASIRGRQDIEIYPQVSGTITKVCVKEGQKVRKGQVLFIIDQVPYRAALQTAEANVSAARTNLETARLELDSKQMLFNEKVVSDYELSNAKNAYNVAQAQLKQAEAQVIQARNSLSYTTVSSPADGVVGTLPYRTGALVSPQLSQPMTTVSDNSQMYVYFSLSEKDLQSLIRQYGSMDKMLAGLPRIGLQLSDGTMYDGDGRIEAVSGVLNASTGSGQLRAVFENKDGVLLTGGTGNVVLPHKLSEAISIPQSATYELQDKIFVYTVVDGKAKSVPISVHPVSDGKTYTVTTGLKEGDIIVTSGVGMIKNGDSVNIQKESK